MNKRQLKKKFKKINERFEYFNSFNIIYGRRCGKTGIILSILEMVYDVRYMKFKRLKKYFKRIGLDEKLRGVRNV